MRQVFTKLWIGVFAVIVVSSLGCFEKVTPPAAAPEGLDGTWAAPCKLGDNPSNSEQQTFTIAGSSMTMLMKMYFGNTTCTGANYITVYSTGTLTVTGDSAQVSGAKEYQVVLATMTITPATSETLTIMNTGICGATDWDVGVAKSVFGCSDMDMQNLTASEISYDIYKIDTAANPDTLQFGVGCDSNITGEGSFCTTSGTRPTTLDTDPSAIFARQ